MRVLSVVGNRPQFIKSAPLSAALREAGIEETVVHTGQHYDLELSQVFFDELGLAEPRNLDLRTADVDEMQPGLEAAIREEAPDAVLVFGDTNSTLAGARAAHAVGLPVAHVEAGLRSGDLSMPGSTTGSRSTGSPPCSSLRTTTAPGRCAPRASQGGSRSSAT